MIRVRKLVLAIAAATSLTSGMAHALGLGEISLQSSLSQPLNANIELLEVRDLDKSEIIPRLASPEDFSKAGVERDFFLSDLKFTPVIMPNGKSVLRVTSNKPVREPYLNFLVEVIWPRIYLAAGSAYVLPGDCRCGGAAAASSDSCSGSCSGQSCPYSIQAR